LRSGECHPGGSALGILFFMVIIAMQVTCIVHVVRTGRSTIWISALIFLPIASTIAYFIAEILPTLQHNRHVRAARQKVVEKLDPERELRAAQQALEITDTMANRTRVADALTALGRHSEALPFYQRGAGPRPDFRTGEKLARSLFLNDKPQEALSVLDGLPRTISQSDQDRTALLRARIFEDLGRHDEALESYAEVMDRMAGDEARCRYAALLLKVGRRGDALGVLEQVEKRMKHIDRHTRAAERPMYDWAMNELAGLRADQSGTSPFSPSASPAR